MEIKTASQLWAEARKTPIGSVPTRGLTKEQKEQVEAIQKEVAERQYEEAVLRELAPLMYLIKEYERIEAKHAPDPRLLANAVDALKALKERLND